MKVSKTVLEKLLYMARLAPSPQEKDALLQDLNKMVESVKKLANVTTKDIQPVVTMSHEANNLRQDVPQKPLSRRQALENAPTRNSDYFQTPTVKK